MAITKVSDLNSLFNTIIEDTLFVARENTIMAGLVMPYGATGWMDRKIPIRPQLSMTEVAEDEDFATPTTFGKSLKATLTPVMYMTQVFLTDRDIETDPDSAQGDAAREAGFAMAENVDTKLLGLFGSFTSSKGTANNALTLSNVAAASAVLVANKARGEVWVVLHPYQWHDIWVELGQPGTQKAFLGDVANEALRRGVVGEFVGLSWARSSNITIDANSDATGAAFTREAIGLDTRRRPRMEPDRDPSFGGGAWELNWSHGYAHGIIRNEFGVYIISDATEPT